MQERWHSPRQKKTARVSEHSGRVNILTTINRNLKPEPEQAFVGRHRLERRVFRAAQSERAELTPGLSSCGLAVERSGAKPPASGRVSEVAGGGGAEWSAADGTHEVRRGMAGTPDSLRAIGGGPASQAREASPPPMARSLSLAPRSANLAAAMNAGARHRSQCASLQLTLHDQWLCQSTRLMGSSALCVLLE